MNNMIQVAERVFRIGVNDRRLELFENMWPLPGGVSYNSYIIRDEKCALLDTVELGSGSGYIDRIESLLEGRALDYMIINHMELDHAGQINEVVRRYPQVKIVGNSKTFGILSAYFDIRDNLLEVKDGDTLSLGHHQLKFVLTPWVHWPETMMTYDVTDGILFSADAFGTFGTLDGGVFDDEIDFSFYEEEMRRYYSNIVGKYSGMVQKALAKLKDTPVKIICPLHGIIWRRDPGKVIGLYDRWSRYEAEEGVVVIYASMYGNTASMADYIARKISEAGIKKVRVYDVSKTHMSYLINEIWKYNGVVLGSCAYNGCMFPAMESLTRELIHIGIKNKKLGLFGSYSWNGGGVKNLNVFAQESGLEMVAPAAEVYGAPSKDKMEACDALAKAVAEAVRG